MKGGKKIAEGGYGCVHLPGLDCDGNDTNDNDYVSKLQKSNFSSKNEVRIGSLIRESIDSKSMDDSFAAVLSSCNINIDKIQSKNISDCSVIKKISSNSELILTKMRFVGKDDLDIYILKKDKSDSIVTYIQTLKHLLIGLKILVDINIVHFDMKGSNVVYDPDKSLPIIIDFGLSIPINDVTPENVMKYFYVYAPEYYIWPLEVHYINMLLHVTPQPDDSKLKDLVKGIVDSHTMSSFTDKFKKEYSKKCYQVLTHYNSLPIKDRMTMISGFWNTWDNYSISILYLNLLFSILKTSVGEPKKHPGNKFIRFMTESLVQNIHPEPYKRLSVEDTIISMNTYFSSATNKDYEDMG